MKEDKRCGTCKFWMRAPVRETLGDCAKYMGGWGSAIDYYFGVWDIRTSRTHRDSVCKLWEPKDEIDTG